MHDAQAIELSRWAASDVAFPVFKYGMFPTRSLTHGPMAVAHGPTMRQGKAYPCPSFALSSPLIVPGFFNLCLGLLSSLLDLQVSSKGLI
jgi:hypothetical protein